MKIGYARVSSYGQSLEVQRQKLKEEECAEIFEEKISALSQKRTELDNALRTIREGDVLIVTKLDRLARSMQDLLQIAKRLQKKDAQLKGVETRNPRNYAVGFCKHLPVRLSKEVSFRKC